MHEPSETFPIYVIEDDDAVRDSVQALLEPAGFVVRAYSSAEAFLQDFEAVYSGDEGRACVLLDLQMPGMGGQELVEILSKRAGDLAIVVMTGNADDKSRLQVLESGAVALLEKPFDADHLTDLLKGLLD